MDHPRTYENPYPITDPFLDYEIWGQGRGGHQKLPPGFMHHSMETHVLLAACRATETAYETTIAGKVRGIFTEALIPALERGVPAQINYERLIRTLTLSSSAHTQIPQSGGRNQNRPLLAVGWTAPVPSFALQVQGDSYRVEAGRIHGVTEGTKFSVHENSTSDPNVSICRATSVGAHHSIIGPASTESLASNASAVIFAWNSDAATLKVFFKDGGLLRRMEAHCSPIRNFSAISDASAANVVVETDDEGGLVMKISDPLFRKFDHLHGLSVSDRKLADVLNHIAQFRYHLIRRPEGNTDTFEGVGSAGMPDATSNDMNEIVEMQLYRLNSHSTFDMSRNLFSGGQADLSSSKENRYGIRIVNHSP
jgi:hypothetical protein